MTKNKNIINAILILFVTELGLSLADTGILVKGGLSIDEINNFDADYDEGDMELIVKGSLEIKNINNFGIKNPNATNENNENNSIELEIEVEGSASIEEINNYYRNNATTLIATTPTTTKIKTTPKPIHAMCDYKNPFHITCNNGTHNETININGTGLILPDNGTIHLYCLIAEKYVLNCILIDDTNVAIPITTKSSSTSNMNNSSITTTGMNNSGSTTTSASTTSYISSTPMINVNLTCDILNNTTMFCNSDNSSTYTSILTMSITTITSTPSTTTKDCSLVSASGGIFGQSSSTSQVIEIDLTNTNLLIIYSGLYINGLQTVNKDGSISLYGDFYNSSGQMLLITSIYLSDQEVSSMIIESSDKLYSLKLQIFDPSLKTYTWTPKMGSSGGNLTYLNASSISSKLDYFQVKKLTVSIDSSGNSVLGYPFVSSIAPTVQASQCSLSAIPTTAATTTSKTSKTRKPNKTTITTTTCITVPGISPVYGHFSNSSKNFVLVTSELNELIFFSGDKVYGLRAIFINNTFRRYGVVANTTGLIKDVSFIYLENMIISGVNVTKNSNGSLTSFQLEIFNPADNTSIWSPKVGDASGSSPSTTSLNAGTLAWKTPLFKITGINGAFDLNGANGISSILSGIQFLYSSLKCN